MSSLLMKYENYATACLESNMIQMMAECIKRGHDCADTCALCARLMSRQFDLHAQMCQVCAEACGAFESRFMSSL